MCFKRVLSLHKRAPQHVAIASEQMHRRGSKLRKADWVIGVVVFTGPDTKVVRNMLPAPRKVRTIDPAWFVWSGLIGLV